jgi:hypothetical protein
MSIGSRRRIAPLLVCALALLVLAAILLPNLFAVGVGRVLADVWVSTMAAVAGVLGGLIGA